SEKIFDRFYRTDKARTKISDKESSVGLGLSVAKWIADRHDIKISVKSKPGEGSTFTLTIPTI
ncbi:MAG: HAMP domain-containing histidine kinase, partial [Selenomonadaceae bacterium]|nr:HAMP domain-containing histidine kinase [Selenomonadaceae bacterium]